MTGGAQGLGLGITRMLVENGARVVIFDMNMEKGTEVATSMQGDGYSVSFQEVDVSSDASVASAFEKLGKDYGRLDIAVNCAGIVGPHLTKTDQVDVKDFDRVYEGMTQFIIVRPLHP